MSAVPARGRRRAETTRRSPIAITAKCIAAVAVVGALAGAGTIAQQLDPSTAQQNISAAGLFSEPSAPAVQAIQAPSNAAISFPGPAVTSNVSQEPYPTLKAESDGVTPDSAPVPVAVDDPAAAKAYAAGQLASFGWGADQMSCLTQLWQRESEWLTSAENASSGAYGIAQSLPANKMESAGSDWASNYQTQIRWGLGYIQERYGSPCGAWGHSNAVGWY